MLVFKCCFLILPLSSCLQGNFQKHAVGYLIIFLQIPPFPSSTSQTLDGLDEKAKDSTTPESYMEDLDNYRKMDSKTNTVGDSAICPLERVGLHRCDEPLEPHCSWVRGFTSSQLSSFLSNRKHKSNPLCHDSLYSNKSVSHGLLSHFMLFQLTLKSFPPRKISIL